MIYCWFQTCRYHFFWILLFGLIPTPLHLRDDVRWAKMSSTEFTGLLRRKTPSRLVIIDTDCGVDDAEAILLALQQPNWKILAITCVAGNTTLKNVRSNVLRVLKVFSDAKLSTSSNASSSHKERAIPVHAGAKKPLNTPWFRFRLPVGYASLCDDGFGGIAHTISIDVSQIATTNAASAMIKLVKSNPLQITLIALGPLTNLANAMKMWPEFLANLKEIFIMGGNHLGNGNALLASEFNFAWDPKAAEVVLSSKCGRPIFVVTLETVRNHTLPWEWYDKWISPSKDGPLACFLRNLLKAKVDCRRNPLKPRSSSGYHSYDLLTMSLAVQPECILEEQSVYATVEQSGKHTRGQMIVDWRSTTGKSANIRLVTKVDTEKIRLIYETVLSND